MNKKLRKGLVIFASLVLITMSIVIAAGFIIIPQEYKDINAKIEQLTPSPDVVNKMILEGCPQEEIDALWDGYDHYVQNVLTHDELMGWYRYYEPEVYIFLSLMNDEEKAENRVEQKAKTITITFDNQTITTTIQVPAL